MHILPHFAAKFLTNFFHHGIVAASVEQGFVKLARHLFNHQMTPCSRVGIVGIVARCHSAPHSQPCKTSGCQQLLFIPLKHHAHLRGGYIGHGVFRPAVLFGRIIKNFRDGAKKLLCCDIRALQPT